MKSNLIHTHFFILLLSILFTGGCTKEVEERLNFIVIYTDDMNFDHLGYYNESIITPTIDNLAANGFILNRYYTSAPVCTPSRYGLLTGRYASRSKTLVNRYPTDEPAFLRWNTHIEEGDKTLAHILNEGGYSTGMVGKYHNFDNEMYQTDCSKLDPLSEDGRECLEGNYSAMKGAVKQSSGFQYVESLYANNLHALGLPAELQQHNMDWVTKGALEFIDQNKETPFFLYVATTIPHGPEPLNSIKAGSKITPAGYLDDEITVQPSRDELLKRVTDAGLPENAAVFTWIDDGITAIMKSLEEKGLLKNTIIIFASDHSGEFSGRAKMTNYEGGVHTPAFVWSPGKIESGGESEALVANIDFVPTVLDLAGIEIPDSYVTDGYNLMPLLKGEEESIRESIFLEITYSRGVVTDRWKYITTRFPSDIQSKINETNYDQFNQEGVQVTHDVLSGRMRSRYNAHEIYPGYFDPDQLYDLENDPGEQKNLFQEPAYSDTIDMLEKELTDYLARFPHSFGEFKKD
ncbi:MAG: sulfatase [Balneola sp.]